MIILPLDIVEEIIGFVDAGWRTREWDLRRAALVCSQWRVPAQRPLFRRLELSLYKDMAKENSTRAISFRNQQTCETLVKRLHQLLQNSPHICLYIREVHLVHFPAELCPTGLLRKLTNVDILKVRGMRFHALPDDIRSDILSLSRSLSELSLDEINFGSSSQFFSLLAHAPRLRTLRLTQIRGIVVGSHEIPQCSPFGPPARIEHLRLDGSSAPFIPSLIRPVVYASVIDITNIRTFHSTRSAIFEDVATMLLPAISPNGTLEELSLHITVTEFPLSLPLSLSSVRHLDLTIAEDPKCNAGPWLSSFFNGFSASASLEDVVLNLELVSDPEDSYWSAFSDLDDTLNSPKFRYLRKVKLILTMDWCASEDDISLRLQRLLPRLYRFDIFEFQVGDFLIVMLSLTNLAASHMSWTVIC
ncbi:hypothetical protein C8J56DRAFT_930869 [Mycena floridula]|nr:hypothetical protein C8J56DRAFT_930869 [Mycena floridula]